MKPILLSGLGLLLLLGSCQKDSMVQPEHEEFVRSPYLLRNSTTGKFVTYFGKSARMGNGNMRAWLTINGQNEPLELGVEIEAAALEGLSSNAQDTRNSVSLQLASRVAGVSPFDHILVRWLPNGRGPAGVYDVPHFDFKFYTISEAERLAIPSYEAASERFDNPPPPGAIPWPYSADAGGSSAGGKEWVNPTAREFITGIQLTHTFVYGSFDGRVVFYDPRIARAVLLENAYISADIMQATFFNPAPGWYPTRYHIWRDNSARVYIAMTGFIRRS